MQTFDQFQKQLEERAALIVEPQTAVLPVPVMTPLDLEVSTLCAAFSQEDVRRSEISQEAQQSSCTALVVVPRTAELNQFNPPPATLKPVEEAYRQLLHHSRNLNSQLLALSWYSARALVQDIVDVVREAHESDQLSDFAPGEVELLASLINGCESFAHTAMQTRHDVAGQLFLLTAIAAHELQMALRHECNC